MVEPNTGFCDQLRALELRLGLGERDCGSSPIVPPLESEEKVEPAQKEDESSEEDAPEDETGTDGVTEGSVEAAVDIYGTMELKLRSEKLRARCQQLRGASGLLSLAAPLRRRRHSSSRTRSFGQ